MKKVIILLFTTSVFLFGYAFYFMQKSANLISQNEDEVYEISELTSSDKLNSLAPDPEFMHYFEDMELKQEDHIIINNCLQNAINNDVKNTSDKCESIILDAIIDKMGHTQFINAIIGNMISYKSDVYLKHDFYKTLFPSKDEKNALSSKLTFAFLNRYRNPEKLKLEFETNKNYFFENMSKTLYQKMFEKTINQFIESYNTISEQKNKEAYYKKIFYEAETKNKHGEFWYITFWKRRELEKNDQVVIEILKEIKNYYAS